MVHLLLAVMALAEQAATLAGLPPRAYAMEQWRLNRDLVNHFEAQSRLYGGTYADACSPVICEAARLRDWWGFAADAMQTHDDESALWNARNARALWDWQVYGWPPTVPYWRFPVWQ